MSFIDHYSNFPIDSNGNHYFSRIYFVDENTGWSSGANTERKNLFKTTNGGNSWSFQNNPITQYFFHQLNDCVFLNKDTGWASSVPGIIIATTNGGEEWFVDLSVPREFWPLEVVKTQSRHFVWSGTDLNRLWKASIDKTVSIRSNLEIIPDSFKLFQNFPNPFNPTTNIKFSLPSTQYTILKIFDALGREVATLVNENLQAGVYQYQFTTDNYQLGSGVYFYRLSAGEFSETKRLVLLK